MTVAVFFVQPAGRSRRYLRRYEQGVSQGDHYHNAMELLDVVEGDAVTLNDPDLVLRDDSRWPCKCETCDYQFTEDDARQLFCDRVYVDDQGGEHSLRDETPGMMWDAYWVGEWAKGPDGRCLCVICPDGSQWMIDGPASNCTNRDDRGPFGSAHRCWVRHGEPPLITVDKNGYTCSAGAGSIAVPGYHGFLRNGAFT